MTSRPSGMSTAPLSLVSSANLLRVHRPTVCVTDESIKQCCSVSSASQNNRLRAPASTLSLKPWYILPWLVMGKCDVIPFTLKMLCYLESSRLPGEFCLNTCEGLCIENEFWND